MKDALFFDYQRLVLFPQLEDNFESFERVMDSGMYISKLVHANFSQEDVTELRNDALILFQMVLTKGIAIRNLCIGIDYYNQIGEFNVNPLHDPMSIANIVRSQFEAFANFHNIFISPESMDIQNFLHNAWIISGLKTRQNYVDEKSPIEHIEKSKKDKELIDYLVNQLKNNPFYLSLDEIKRKWIIQRINKRTFEFLIKDGKIETPGWKGLFMNSGVIKEFENQYSYLSLLTHPSNVSVFQFDHIHEENKTFEMSISLMNRSKEIMAFLINDYCTFIPNAIKCFNLLPQINKIIIDSINTQYRHGISPLDENREQFYVELGVKLREHLEDSENRD